MTAKQSDAHDETELQDMVLDRLFSHRQQKMRNNKRHPMVKVLDSRNLQQSDAFFCCVMFVLTNGFDDSSVNKCVKRGKNKTKISTINKNLYHLLRTADVLKVKHKILCGRQNGTCAELEKGGD